MCELLALSSSRPARLTFSLHALAARGATAGTSPDGWGVAFYQEADVALFREPAAAGESELVRYLESRGPATNLAISHIRHATRGEVHLANTQPFARELGGRMHVFAHNGDLPGIWSNAALAVTSLHRPIGQTDSEYAYCALLARLRLLWEPPVPPSLQVRLEVLATFASDLRAVGPANFLYADGDALFVHGHRRIQRATGKVEAPGLWLLQRHCKPTGALPSGSDGLAIDQGDQTVVLIASVPLTDEVWRPLSEGELVAVRNGEVLCSKALA